MLFLQSGEWDWFSADYYINQRMGSPDQTTAYSFWKLTDFTCSIQASVSLCVPVCLGLPFTLSWEEDIDSSLPHFPQWVPSLDHCSCLLSRWVTGRGLTHWNLYSCLFHAFQFAVEAVLTKALCDITKTFIRKALSWEHKESLSSKVNTCIGGRRKHNIVTPQFEENSVGSETLRIPGLSGWLSSCIRLWKLC